MSCAYPVFAKPLLDFGGEAQQAKHICDGGPILPNTPRNFFLNHAEVDDKPLICLSFFDGIQVFPLKVLD
jgi:hypothetical protein